MVGIKVHSVIHANDGVPSDIKFTSATTNDSFMLRSSTLGKGDIVAMNCVYIDYEKPETLTQREVLYVTKMNKNLKYSIKKGYLHQTTDGLIEASTQHITSSKVLKGGEALIHHVRIITYVGTFSKCP